MTKELEAWERARETVERSDGDADITKAGDLATIDRVFEALKILSENRDSVLILMQELVDSIEELDLIAEVLQ